MSGNEGSRPRFEDWVIIWHSELAGLVTDPETTEAVLRALDLWAEGARAVARAADRALDDAALPPPRPPAAPAAPDERDLAIARLLRRVDELERRLDRLSPGS